MVVSFPDHRVSTSSSTGCGRTADGGPAPFGPARDPPAADHLEPLSTERPGPTRGRTSPAGGHVPRSRAALSLAPSDGAPVRHTVPDPAAPARVAGRSPVGRPVVDPAEPTGPLRPPVNSRSTCTVCGSCLVRGEDAQVARRGRGP